MHPGYLRLHTLRMCNTHCFYTATVVPRTRVTITLHIHCLSCVTCILQHEVYLQLKKKYFARLNFCVCLCRQTTDQRIWVQPRSKLELLLLARSSGRQRSGDKVIPNCAARSRDPTLPAIVILRGETGLLLPAQGNTSLSYSPVIKALMTTGYG